MLALCSEGIMPYVGFCSWRDLLYIGFVSWWDHTLYWHGVIMGPYLMLAWCSDVTHFFLALCPGVTYFIWVLFPYPNDAH